MSGPITPPLEVTEVDGSPDGRPITKIVVSNGDLSISGRTATIDTSGSTTTPGGSDGQIQYNNSGAFGASAILSTNKTTTVTINSGASGDANLDLTSDTKSITLKVDTNQKLKVQGGANSFVFDASSGTGGITWPDGTTQTTAASAGEFNAVLTNADDINSPYNLNRIDSTPPWGMNTGNQSQASRDQPMFFPFIANETSTVSGIVIECTTAAASAVDGVVAIYSDNNGVPDSKLGSDATFDMTTTGQKEQTSVGTISLTKGDQYWVGFTRSASESFNWRCGQTQYPWMGPTENLLATWYIFWIPSGSDNALPATITSTDLEPRGFVKISVGLNQ